MSVFRSMLMLFLLYSASLQAAPQKSGETKSAYYIRLASYLNENYAKKAYLASDLPVKLVFEDPFYTLLNGPYPTKEEAKKHLRNILKRYKDAYLIHLQTEKSTQKRTIKQTDTTHSEQTNTSLLQQGITLYNTKRYEEALALFDRVMIFDPQNLRAKLYYTQTLVELGLYDEARKKLHELKESPLYKTEHCKIAMLEDTIRTRQKRHFWQIALETGIGYNDNINLTTDNPYTRYGPYLLQNNTRKTDSRYALATLFLRHRYQNDRFGWTTTLYSYNELFHSAKGNTLNYLNVTSAIDRKFNRQFLSAAVGADTVRLGGEKISDELFFKPAWGIRISTSTRLNCYTQITKNFTRFAPDRDYDKYEAGTLLSWQQGGLKTVLSASAAKYDAKSDKRFDVAKNLSILSLYLKYHLSTHLDATVGIVRESHRYTRRDPVLGYRRKDIKKRWQTQLQRKLTAKSALQLSYEYTRSDANINLYTYKNRVGTLVWKYHF